MSEQKLLEWCAIKTWALQQPEKSIIGNPSTNISCPLANYLHEKTGECWSVGPSIRTMGIVKERLSKPLWVEAIMKMVDVYKETIKREQFLEILDNVKEEYQYQTTEGIL